eukprot:gene21837-biopygen19204
MPRVQLHTALEKLMKWAARAGVAPNTFCNSKAWDDFDGGAEPRVHVRMLRMLHNRAQCSAIAHISRKSGQGTLCIQGCESVYRGYLAQIRLIACHCARMCACTCARVRMCACCAYNLGKVNLGKVREDSFACHSSHSALHRAGWRISLKYKN